MKKGGEPVSLDSPYCFAAIAEIEVSILVFHQSAKHAAGVIIRKIIYDVLDYASSVAQEDC